MDLAHPEQRQASRIRHRRGTSLQGLLCHHSAGCTTARRLLQKSLAGRRRQLRRALSPLASRRAIGAGPMRMEHLQTRERADERCSTRSD